MKRYIEPQTTMICVALNQMICLSGQNTLAVGNGSLQENSIGD